jgi:hypothetical protein
MSLITYQKLNEIKPVSVNNRTKIEQIIKETEELELDKLLGPLFYQEVVDNYTPTTTATTETTIYQDLVEGSTFVDSCNNTVTQKGLWYVLSYLVYGNYIEVSYINDTLTGFVQKTRPDAQPISQGAIKNLVNKNREIAFNYFNKVREFLCENYNEFDNWSANKEKKDNDFKFFGINKTKG